MKGLYFHLPFNASGYSVHRYLRVSYGFGFIKSPHKKKSDFRNSSEVFEEKR